MVHNWPVATVSPRSRQLDGYYRAGRRISGWLASLPLGGRRAVGDDLKTSPSDPSAFVRGAGKRQLLQEERTNTRATI
jgi:hypothetical protein